MVRVVDTSVAIKWFVLEDGREESLEILKQILAAPDRFAVPELFYFELTHVFNRLIPHPTEKALELLNQICLLGIHRFSMTPDLLAHTREFQSQGLSGYDAAYVGLARHLKGKWLTFDAKAHALVKSAGLSVLMGAE